MITRRPSSRFWQCSLAGVIGLSSCGKDAASDGAAAGEKAFVAYCAACHGQDGRGVDRAGPPFVGSSWVDGPDSRFVRIILHGVRGTIDVGGTTYNLEMPSFGGALTDDQVAQVICHVRRRFGANQNAVEPSVVARIRAETSGRDRYFTAAELMAVK